MCSISRPTGHDSRSTRCYFSLSDHRDAAADLVKVRLGVNLGYPQSESMPENRLGHVDAVLAA